MEEEVAEGGRSVVFKEGLNCYCFTDRMADE